MSSYPVTDRSDTRVLIPRVRRALDGPHATGSASVAASLSDDEVNNVVADSLAALILYTTGTIFGATLEVVERDTNYLAPTAWKTSRELTESEQMLVAFQAALDYFYRQVDSIKTSETIKDEGQEWSYTLSATVLNQRLNQLRDQRDRALEIVLETTEMPEEWISFIQVRDSWVSSLIEPWVSGGSTGGQLLSP